MLAMFSPSHKPIPLKDTNSGSEPNSRIKSQPSSLRFFADKDLTGTSSKRQSSKLQTDLSKPKAANDNAGDSPVAPQRSSGLRIAASDIIPNQSPREAKKAGAQPQTAGTLARPELESRAADLSRSLAATGMTIPGLRMVALKTPTQSDSATRDQKRDIEVKDAKSGSPDKSKRTSPADHATATGNQPRTLTREDAAPLTLIMDKTQSPTVASQMNPVKSAHPPTPAASAYIPSTLELGDLTRQIKFNLESGRRELIVHLKPEILGRAMILMQQDAGGLSLEFQLEREASRQAVEAQTQRLQEALADLGFNNVTISVKAVGDEASSWAGQTSPDGDHRERRQSKSSPAESPESQPGSAYPRMFGYNTFEIAA